MEGVKGSCPTLVPQLVLQAADIEATFLDTEKVPEQYPISDSLVVILYGGQYMQACHA